MSCGQSHGSWLSNPHRSEGRHSGALYDRRYSELDSVGGVRAHAAALSERGATLDPRQGERGMGGDDCEPGAPVVVAS